MTSRERILRMIEHREADRIAVFDSPWESTVERWEREGMPKGADYIDYFGIDAVRQFKPDNSPRYPMKTIEETADYRIFTSEWGVTMKEWKHAASTPEFVDFTITDPGRWREARVRMDADQSRIDWADLKEKFGRWNAEGAWIHPVLWFGYDITHSWIVGTERVLMALIEEPEWLKEMWEVELDTSLRLLELIWDRGFRFQGVKLYDDMGYKKNQFFSLKTYRELLKPFHKRAIDWAHDRGIKFYLHSCGDINPFVPDLVEMGLDILNPLEVKAGMDPFHLKETYGQKLAFHGGLDALLYEKEDKAPLFAQVEKLIPALKKNGGFIFGSDHSVPDTVSLETFKQLVARAKDLGKY